MTKDEELRRAALLHRQAAFLLREEAERHDQAAREINGDSPPWARRCFRRILRTAWRVRRWTLERKIDLLRFDRGLSLRIDRVIAREEGFQ